MSQLEQFVVDAIKTESRVESIKANEELLTATLQIMIHAGNILDQIKKNTFYDKPFDVDALINHAHEINDFVLLLNHIDTNTIVDNKTEFGVNPRLFHSIVGIATESTELLEALDLSGTKMDNVNLGEEFGDIDWYKAIGCDELNISWDTILNAVIAKLKERYPDNFTSEDAINRNLDKEREILNTMETE